MADPKSPATDAEKALADIHHAEQTILHWKSTLQGLQNDLANQAGTLLASVEYVAGLCPPERTDDKEAVEDIRLALKRILEITGRIQRL